MALEKAILLAAGQGKRLQPITNQIPKPLIPVGGRPIIEWILMSLKDIGIRKIAVIVGYLEDHLREYLHDGSDWNLEIQCFRQDTPNGTAHALLPAESFIGDAPFFLGYGDIITEPVNYLRLAQAFQQNPTGSFISGWEVENPSMGGVLITSDRSNLISIIEKPEPNTVSGKLINAGLMILQSGIWPHIHQVKKSIRGEYELTDSLKTYLQSFPIQVIELRDFWTDVGTPLRLSEADHWATWRLLTYFSGFSCNT